jgi:hypothetical protein
LDGNSADEVQIEPTEFVQFQEFIEVDVEQFEDEAGMASEEEGVFELDDV